MSDQENGVKGEDDYDSKDRRRSRSRSRGKKKKSQTRSRSRSRGRRRRSRSRDRGRKSRDRSRRDKGRKKRSDSRSRSRSDSRRRRRKKKPTNFDVSDPQAQQQQKLRLQQYQEQLLKGRAQELYIGNLQIGVVTKDHLHDIFTKLITSLPEYQSSEGPPVLNVQMHGEGKFAFVQFRNDELATTAMKFDKMMLFGRPINIGRPSGYQQPFPPIKGLEIPQEVYNSVGLIGPPPPTNVFPPNLFQQQPQPQAQSWPQQQSPGTGSQPGSNKKQRELYVGNLAQGVVGRELLMELFTAGLAPVPGGGPGSVVGVTMDPSGKFAFVEFRTEDLAALAMQTFNGVELAGLPLTIGRPAGYVPPQQAPNSPTPFLPQLTLPANMPTHFLKLDNLTTLSELQDDQEYEDIVQDIRDECGKYGKVIDVRLPRTGPNAGSCYVQFITPTVAQAAQSKLDRRTFGPNTIKAAFVPAFPQV